MATKRWLGNAASVYDLWTFALSGTVTSQTYTMTINSKTVTYTSDGAGTVTIILAALASAWNASTIPEFAEYTATALPAGGPYTSMTVTAKTSGIPGTISVSTSGAATFTITNTTAGTGPNDFTNAVNWSGGVAPANSDTLVFDNGSTDCKYNLSTSLTGVTVSVEQGYSGKIGLPVVNTNNPSTSYYEYRTVYLTLAGGTAVINSGNVTRCNLAFGANATTVRVLNTSSQRPDSQTPIVLITGGNGSSELDITKGDVGLAIYAGTTATFPTIKTAFATNPAGDVNLTIGSGATLTTVVKNGGTLTTRSGATTITQGIAGGTLTLLDAVAATTVNIQNGTLNYGTTGTIATIKLYNNAILNADFDPRAKAVTNNIEVYDDTVKIKDNSKTINSGTLSINMNGLQSFPGVEHGAQTTMVLT